MHAKWLTLEAPRGGRRRMSRPVRWMHQPTNGVPCAVTLGCEIPQREQFSNRVCDHPRGSLRRWFEQGMKRPSRETHDLGRRLRRLSSRLLGVVVLVVLVGLGVAWWLYVDARVDTRSDEPFTSPLRVPPLAEDMSGQDGLVHFSLNIEAGESQLFPGEVTETWGINGPYLGPTLRADIGDTVQIDVRNSIGETTTVHWHGMHLPAEMDGGPHQEIDPGATWSPTWTIDQPAATLWYHPHQMGKTADHVYRGVAGLFILDDPNGSPTLPTRYGVDDIPLVLQDKRVYPDGALNMDEGPGNLVGVLGDRVLVNGTYRPYIDATTEQVRLRVLNASNARVYNLGFDDDRRFWTIASDSGLLETPVEAQRRQISPGERVEIVFAIAPEETTRLQSFPPDLGMGFPLDRFNGGDDYLDILEVRGAETLEPMAPPPRRLTTLDLPEERESSNTRSFDLEGFSRINGKEMDIGRVDATVTRNTTEIWELHNAANTYHNFHVHDVHFRVLDIDGAEPPVHLQGWKDTLFLPPGTSARIISRFEDYSDPTSPFMFHCHILTHEDSGMMGQFVVVEPDRAGNG